MRDDEGATLRRYVASLNQSLRMFGHHRPDGADATPVEPEERIGENRSDEDLETELDELEHRDEFRFEVLVAVF